MNTSASLSRRDFLRHTLAGVAVAGAAHLPAQEQKPSRRFTLVGFTKPFQQLSFEETADVVAEVGWDGIECPVRARGQILPEHAEEQLPKLHEALRKRGLEISVLATDVKKAGDPLTQKVLRTASRLGIKRYRLAFWKYSAQEPIPTQLKRIKADLAELAALNRELGLVGGFQNHSGADYVGAPIWDIHQLIQDLDPNHLGICFDIGHATLEGGYSWPIEARLMEPRFSAIYVKDFAWTKKGDRWQADWCPLGDGMVPRKFFSWLKESSFSGPISQHHEYEVGSGRPMIQALRKDLEILKEWLRA